MREGMSLKNGPISVLTLTGVSISSFLPSIGIECWVLIVVYNVHRKEMTDFNDKARSKSKQASNSNST